MFSVGVSLLFAGDSINNVFCSSKLIGKLEHILGTSYACPSNFIDKNLILDH